MLKKIVIALLLHSMCVIGICAQFRAFNDIFPNISQNERSAVFEKAGLVKTDTKSNGFNIIDGNKPAVGIDPVIINTVLSMDPGYLVESISIIQGDPQEITLLDIYNALGNIRGLKGRLYRSATRKQVIPLFEDATRITSEKQTTPIPDPSPSKAVPSAETVFVKLKDANFGNSFYRGEVKLVQKGLCYTLTNFKSLNYLFVPVIKGGNFIALLYFEPIKEGVLIYGFAGVKVSDFFAEKIDMDSAISKRLAVIISWAADGIKKQ
ncbi:MAG: hypothetical protein LBV17_10905 [Treponema sp.]|jgi:hypothetical protein|nr:hypothetical protein [Treponema sp.]